MGARLRHLKVLLVVCLVALPATAALAAPSNVDMSRAIIARVKPDGAGQKSHIIFRANLSKDLNRGGRTARSIVFRFARGFSINRGAVRTRCSSGQARAHSCPVASQIGAASFVTTVREGAQQVAGQVKLYLGTAQRAAGGAVKADVQAGGHRRSTTGQLVHINDSVYAYELRIDNLSSAAGGSVERIHADVGAIHNSGGRRVSLITNPSICSGGWHYGVAVTYTDGARHRGDGVVSCRER